MFHSLTVNNIYYFYINSENKDVRYSFLLDEEVVKAVEKSSSKSNNTKNDKRALEQNLEKNNKPVSKELHINKEENEIDIESFISIQNFTKDQCNSIFKLFNTCYLSNKYHFVELYIYYTCFLSEDQLDKDSFILASTVLIIIFTYIQEPFHSFQEESK